MKRLFVLLLVVLLPLRGWAGDFMGMRMVGMEITGAQTVGGHATGGHVAHGGVVASETAMPPDCPMHAAMQQHSVQLLEDGAAAGDEHSGGVASCTSCDLCLPLATLACHRFDFVTLASDDRPLIGVDDFVSASLAPTEKPPIL